MSPVLHFNFVSKLYSGSFSDKEIVNVSGFLDKIILIFSITVKMFTNRKKAVRAAVIAKWPGNDLTNFKKQPSQLQVLNQLVEELENDCTYLTVGFNKEAVRQHI